MEPLRPVVDSLLIEFLRSHTFSRTDFPFRDDGMVRLHPQLARVVAAIDVAEPIVDRIVQDFSREIASLGNA